MIKHGFLDKFLKRTCVQDDIYKDILAESDDDKANETGPPPARKRIASQKI